MGRVSKHKAGDPLRIPATEWNALADVANGAITQQRGPIGSIAQSITVLVRNDTGEDLDRYRCIALGDPLFDLAPDGSADLIFEGKKADPDKPAAICVEPIAHDATNKRFGRVWIHGLAYAWVGPASAVSDLSAVPSPTSNRLKPGYGLVRLLAQPSTSDEKLLPVLLASAVRANRAIGLINASFAGTPTSFVVKNVTGLDGYDPIPSNATLTVQNRYSWEKGTVDFPIEITFNPKGDNWIPVQMRCAD